MTATPETGDTLYDPIYPLAKAMATCLCTTIESLDNVRPVEASGLIPGDQVFWDYGGYDCDQAGVRVSAQYPARGINVPDDRPVRCGSPTGYELEVGIARCWTQAYDERNAIVPMNVADEMAQVQALDHAAIRMAVRCCFGEEQDVVLSAGRTEGPLGDVIQVVYTLSGVV